MNAGSPAALALAMLVTSAARAEAPGPAAPPSPSEALQALSTEYDDRFPMAGVYWGGAGALLVTGVVLLAVSPSPSTNPGDRLNVFSGTATLLSGVSCGLSALPPSLSRATLRRRLAEARASGKPMDDAVALEILTEHAGWARRWRIATQVVSPTLLAVNGSLMGWYAWHNGYERVTAGVIAGLYGIGVPVVLWWYSRPTTEEQALEKAGSRGAPLQVSLGPTIVPSRSAIAPGLGLSGAF